VNGLKPGGFGLNFLVNYAGGIEGAGNKANVFIEVFSTFGSEQVNAADIRVFAMSYQLADDRTADSLMLPQG
jgi:hypothetical protein